MKLGEKIDLFNEVYNYIYEREKSVHQSINESNKTDIKAYELVGILYDSLVKLGDMMIKSKDTKIRENILKFNEKRQDILSSDREVVAYVISTIKEWDEEQNG